MNDTQIKMLTVALCVIIIAAGLLPCAIWIGGMIFAWRAYHYLGYWPRYGHPDPKDIPVGFAPQTQFLQTGIPVAFVVISTLVLVVLITRRNKFNHWIGVSTLMAFGAFIVAIILFWLDPGAVFCWIAD